MGWKTGFNFSFLYTLAGQPISEMQLGMYVWGEISEEFGF